METFRILVHLCFDAATALLYTASIALVTATATVVYSQRLAAGLLIAAISFFVVAIFYGRKIWRTYRPGLRGQLTAPRPLIVSG
jgi:hypothetical protein